MYEYSSVEPLVSTQEVERSGDIRSRIVAHLSFDGQKSLVSDLVQSLQPSVEIHISLPERGFLKALLQPYIPNASVGKVSIYRFAAYIAQHTAILSVSVDDIAAEGVYGLYRIVSGDHYQIGWIQIDRYTWPVQAV